MDRKRFLQVELVRKYTGLYDTEIIGRLLDMGKGAFQIVTEYVDGLAEGKRLLGMEV